MTVAALQEDFSSPEQERSGSLRAVRLWLWILAALVIAMVTVGGATRLTGSGLSITEWRPVTGAVPPLSPEAWATEFEKYRLIPQYDLVNKGMTLDEFKVIYAWEWSHRQLGRLIGIAFFLPLAWFWLKGIVRGRLALALAGLGALGGLQGAIGWIMVASGLEPGMTAVAPIKLTLHLLTASLILAGLVWIAGGLRERMPAPPAAPRRPGLFYAALVLVGLILVQIALGGLVAGSKAGFTYNTWPLMDGALIPPASVLFSQRPWIENFVDNLALVQLDHRLLAYAVAAATLWHALAAYRVGAKPLARRAAALAGLTLAQVGLGILTLVLVVPLWAGLAHQVLAMLVLSMAVAHARLCQASARRDSRKARTPGLSPASEAA